MGQKGNQEMYPDETIRFDLGDNTYKDFSFREKLVPKTQLSHV